MGAAASVQTVRDYKRELRLPDCDEKQPGIEEIKTICGKISGKTFGNIYHVYASLKQIREIAIKPPIQTCIFETKIEQKISRRRNYGNRSRHKEQQCTFVENVLRNISVDDNTTVLEIGAGKAELSYIFAEETKCDNFMIDIKASRGPLTNRMIEGKYKYVIGDATTYSYHSDPFLINKKKIVVVAKHFCSHYIDLAINQILRLPNVAAIFYSPCCFEKMHKHAYIFPKHVSALTDDEFRYIATKTNWGTMPAKKIAKDQFMPYLNEIGRIFRDYLQIGRIKFLEHEKFTVTCYNYVPYETTPQNLFLCAIRSI
ncbi:MAG: tRNA:m(4)X modification enzyme TRM13-like protein [Hyperionvirus sp.]|uniref:tRNA:m(4)X modification enzyme TRM13-like protein n=1 Tax=Hyperionvirus sp. TaxID=2487770 RepID=A0A3G5A7G6_9VIRU|nr:MAG: tRNA:m(4)X modification enzyme TRM13-like protein [Hyperionvirus sp.]